MAKSLFEELGGKYENKKECGGNRQWQNHYLRNWAANTKGKGII